MSLVIEKLPVEVEVEGIKFFLVKPWSKESLYKVVDLIRNPENYRKPEIKNGNLKALSGRGMIRFIDIPECGSMAVKQYRRGGLMRLVIKENYLRSQYPRPAVEISILKKAKDLGINVPNPIGYATEGKLLYKAWLLTEEVPSHESLSVLSVAQPDKLGYWIDQLVAQVSILIAAGICHVDLHPGNVVVSKDDVVFLLDFDKAEEVDWEKKELRDTYLFRWRRAVIKHRLPEQLSELFCLGLRRSAILELGTTQVPQNG